MTATTRTAPRRGHLQRRIAGQGALLLAGFGVGQTLSLARNSVLGYALAKGDFGIAALLTLTLQLVEMLSEPGADRLIVQAPDGGEPRLVANAHALLLARGIVSAAVLYALADPLARFFAIPEQAGLFAALALVPLIRGFAHLDQRVRQRRLDNRAHLASETGGQAIALAATLLLVAAGSGPAVVVWSALAQAVSTVAISHALADARWQVAANRSCLRRLLLFGWPIWLSAFPLAAVYQADRVLIARVLGLEALAGYAAAFLLTLVPSLIVAKVAQALLLPLLAECRDDPHRLTARHRVLGDAAAIVALVYVVGASTGGGAFLEIAFGPSFAGHGALVTGLALMWAIRMIQAVPGMTLLAVGRPQPLLTAGLIRAAAFPLAGLALQAGAGLGGVVAAGVIGEFASLLYLAWTVRRLDGSSLRPALFGVIGLAAAATAGHLGAEIGLAGTTLVMHALAAITAALLTGLVLSLACPPVRREIAAAARFARGDQGPEHGRPDPVAS